MRTGSGLALAILFSAALLFDGRAYGQSVSTGGKLYDNWWEQVGVAAPDGNQPLWASQSSNTRSGGDTWRCKECHGWDHKGMDGAYGSGSHRTGFPGLMANAPNLSADELTAWLNGTANKDHDFSAMGASQIPHLVRFLREGLVDVTPYIDANKAAIGGNRAHGAELFAGLCGISACHGADGRAIEFHDAEVVGTIAKGNPWEFLHKVRSGSPGAPMPAAIDIGWSMADVVDVLDFAQTLPTEAGTSVQPVGWAEAKQAAGR